ncbi:MAG TPA: hypothetical protein VN238_11985 [Solirubrobacteraceae bacterium]|nr:hypothetical protein [Solirubrobacteraceae bacterium]
MSERRGTVSLLMRLGVLVLTTLAVGSFTPPGQALQNEIRDVRASQYERGKRAACNIRVLNAVTSQDEAQIRAVEQRCARFFADAPAVPASPQG